MAKRKVDDRPWMAVDIDHTLSGAWWRDHLIPDWSVYYKEQEKDPIIEETAMMIRSLHGAGWGIVGLTAREEKYRAETTRYMVKHDVPMDELLMRPREDYRASPALKLSTLSLRFPGLYGIKLILDDREDVCKAFLEKGVTCLQVHAFPRMPKT